MVFWLAVLVGALFAWIAVRIGFYATWILFFHLLLAAYVAIFLAPVLVADVPAATAIPGYGYALTLVSIAVATLFVGYGTCYACLSGRLRLEFPRVLDTSAAGVLGFLAGFLVWSFMTFAFSLTPLAQTDVCKRLGLDARSQKTNTSYVCWWCNGLHSMLRCLGTEITSGDAVEALVQEATEPAAKPAQPGTPPAPPAPPPPPLAAAPGATAAPGANPVAPPVANHPSSDQGGADFGSKSRTAPPPPPSVAPINPPRRQVDPLDDELSHRCMMIYSSDAIPAAVANAEVRIIEVTDACNGDRFDARQTKLLQDWVSEGGMLWVSNNVLKLFGIRYSRLERDNPQWPCTVSEAAEVAPLVGQCKKVTLTGAGSKARILAAKGVLPLLMLENSDPFDQKPGMPCWSLVRYGKGWISDRKPVDRTRDDGEQFWRNFCRFCLRNEGLDVAPGEESSGGVRPPAAASRGPLAGAWQASTGAQFRINDDGKVVIIDLIASDSLQRLTGRLVRRDESSDSPSLSGILDAIFKLDPTKRYAIDVTATVADPGHLRLRCTNWPKWNSKGKFLAKVALTEIWKRSEGVFEPPAQPEKNDER